MNIKQYIKESSRTCPDLGYREKNNLHMVLGISTESGELLDTFKKNLAYRKNLDWVNIEEEIGDIMWYISNFCRINNLDFENILDKNIEKLKIRYPEKFTEEKALNRNLDAERTKLEF
jgi:NTP pyrophosphatase (non-canonical NTP hydrolase)